MNKKTVVIVDPEKLLVDLLIYVLSSDEIAVFGATSAAEGIRLLDRHMPDLLVIDPEIPDGFQVLDFLRPGGTATNVVVVAGSEEIQNRARTLDIGTVVEKRNGLESFLEPVRRALGVDVLTKGREDAVRVLVTDDEETNRDVLSEFLRTRGYAVMLARNGREAIDQVKSDPKIQIVLLDVSMPGVGGMEALTAIMASAPHPAVIMLTGVADKTVAGQALKLGAFDYILKPFDFVAIESSISVCLSQTAYKKTKSWWRR